MPTPYQSASERAWHSRRSPASQSSGSGARGASSPPSSASERRRPRRRRPRGGGATTARACGGVDDEERALEEEEGERRRAGVAEQRRHPAREAERAAAEGDLQPDHARVAPRRRARRQVAHVLEAVAAEPRRDGEHADRRREGGPQQQLAHVGLDHRAEDDELAHRVVEQPVPQPLPLGDAQLAEDVPLHEARLEDPARRAPGSPPQLARRRAHTTSAVERAACARVGLGGARTRAPAAPRAVRGRAAEVASGMLSMVSQSDARLRERAVRPSLLCEPRARRSRPSGAQSEPGRRERSAQEEVRARAGERRASLLFSASCAQKARAPPQERARSGQAAFCTGRHALARAMRASSRYCSRQHSHASVGFGVGGRRSRAHASAKTARWSAGAGAASELSTAHRQQAARSEIQRLERSAHLAALAVNPTPAAVRGRGRHHAASKQLRERDGHRRGDELRDASQSAGHRF